MNIPENLQLLDKRTNTIKGTSFIRGGDNYSSVAEPIKLPLGHSKKDYAWARNKVSKNTVLRSIGAGVGGYAGKAEAAARLAAGDYVGGGIGLALQTKPVQTELAKRLTQLSSKAIPGLGMTLGAMQTAGYASQGRWTQAGIAAFGTAFSEVPVAGDVVQGLTDLTNLGLDIATGNLVPSTDPDDIATRRRLNRAIGNHLSTDIPTIRSLSFLK